MPIFNGNRRAAPADDRLEVRPTGAWLKLGTMAIALLVSYVLTSIVLGSAPALLGYLNLSASPSTSYSLLARDFFSVVSIVTIASFFTLPAMLAAFGHGGAWVKHVLARFGKGVLAAFVASFLFYVGAAASATLQIGPSFASVSSAVPVLGLAGLLALAVLSRDLFLRLAEAAVGSLSLLLARLANMPRKGSAAAVELRITATKPIRGRSDERVLQQEALRFQRFARALATVGRTSEFKLSFRGGRGTVLILASGREDRQAIERRLLAVARTYLPEARPVPVAIESEDSQSSTVLLSGAPEAAPNPLEPVARFFIENGFEGDYAVVFRAHGSNPVTRLIVRREQRKLARESAKQRSVESLVGDQNSTTEQDYFVGKDAEAAAKKVERQTSPQSIEAWIYVFGRGRSAGEAQKLAESAAAVVMASLSSHRDREELKVSKQRRPFRDLQPHGRPSVILPVEAAPLVWVPQMAIGTEVEPSVEFELPPELKGEIDLGEIVLQSGRSGHRARIPLDDLIMHLFLTGMTGSGKTTSAFNLLLQLHDHGVPFLVIEPVKAEYRSLSMPIEGLQVFTPGDEKTAPFRLNIFEPPPGVTIAKHLEALEAAWNGSFVMYAPLPYVVKEVLVETYVTCGWDLKKDVRGRPITLEDFRLSAKRVVEKLGYARDETANIGAALDVRISNLALGGKGPLFNTAASTPLEAMLRRPTVIELKDIPSSEEKAFVAALLLSNIAEYLEAKGASKGLRHVTLVEEAHRLLPNVSTAKGDPEAADPRKTLVEQFANMLAEVRAYGEGLVIVEQIPTKILPDAIKNTATKVAHRVPAKDDREAMAGSMGMTDEQSEVLTALKPGEAVVHLQRHPLPIRITAENHIKEFAIPVGEVSDKDVMERMRPFYLKNPLPRPPGWVLVEALRKEIDTEAFRAKFRAAYGETIRRRNPEPIIEIATEIAKSVARDEIEQFLITITVVQMAVAFHLPFDEADRERFPREVMAYMTRKERHARRG